MLICRSSFGCQARKSGEDFLWGGLGEENISAREVGSRVFLCCRTGVLLHRYQALLTKKALNIKRFEIQDSTTENAVDACSRSPKVVSPVLAYTLLAVGSTKEPWGNASDWTFSKTNSILFLPHTPSPLLDSLDSIALSLYTFSVNGLHPNKHTIFFFYTVAYYLIPLYFIK